MACLFVSSAAKCPQVRGREIKQKTTIFVVHIYSMLQTQHSAFRWLNTFTSQNKSGVFPEDLKMSTAKRKKKPEKRLKLEQADYVFACWEVFLLLSLMHLIQQACTETN